MSIKENIARKRKIRRMARIRKSISRGTSHIPRLSVFRSNTHIYAQLVDDTVGKTLVSVSSLSVKDIKGKKQDISKEIGKLLAKKAKEKKITKAVFDRGSYRYHGRVKAVADGAREEGLNF